MKKIIPMLLILFIASCKKEEFDSKLTKTFSIQSTFAGAEYDIHVALPYNYDPTSNKYTTLYVLDGKDNFAYVANQTKAICCDLGAKNVLVVGIGYGNNRSFDYTPTKADHNGGGANKFMQFIKYELIPKIEADFGADTSRKNRVILGHSFGGLLAAYAFTNYNEVFGNYLMLSPSLWYDNEIIFRYEEENRASRKLVDQLVFMGLGSLENSGRMMAPFEAFNQRLQKNYPSMKIEKHIVPQLNHMGSRNPNIQQSLKFFFQNR